MNLGLGRTEFAPTLVPLPEGQYVALEYDALRIEGARVSFVDDGEVLEEAAIPVLDQVIELLRVNEDLSVRVVAHTDDNGMVENTELQAGVVVSYLTDNGLLERRLRAEGAGGARPLFPNISNRNRRRNRRVEFLFTR